jgi:hypothetical protein
MDPETVPYPWRGALVMWVLLGAEALLLYFLIHRAERLLLGLALTTFLLIATVLSSVTDMPGYYYVPQVYQLALGMACGILVVNRAIAKKRGRPVPPAA